MRGFTLLLGSSIVFAQNTDSLVTSVIPPDQTGPRQWALWLAGLCVVCLLWVAKVVVQKWLEQRVQEATSQKAGR